MIERFAQMPTALRANSRWQRLGNSLIPTLLVHPDWESGRPVPIMLWMHGRTVNKELDPGRYLRWVRAGIATCAIDLPGHGERLNPTLQRTDRAFDVVRQMIDEIDEIVESLRAMHVFDMTRIGIGGMSAGGMATLARLCRPHAFRCASVEATTGSWNHQAEREMFREVPDVEMAALNPIEHLEDMGGWREIPFQAIHAQRDEWVPIAGQEAFIHALRDRYADPDLVEFITYDRTGAPNEHQGFGKMASDAKDRQRDFLQRWLMHPIVA